MCLARKPIFMEGRREACCVCVCVCVCVWGGGGGGGGGVLMVEFVK